MGTRLGPFFGAVTLVLLEDVAIEMGARLALVFPDQSAQLLTSFRPIMFGSVLILFLIFEPRGLAYRWNLLKAAWRLRPFAR
jgi:branched-chain amino acid transport system permease protein